MHIAITGGSGRIGRAVTALALAEGHGAVNIDRAPPQDTGQAPFIQAEVTDYAALVAALQGCDALIHLAAFPSPGGHPPHVVHNNNVVGSYNALCAAVELGIERVCLASSINAIGGVYSRAPRYDYFPVDEQHPTYNEDPYSLSKWICELQGDSIARRHETMRISSLRFHGVVPDRETMARYATHRPDLQAKHLWGYTSVAAASRACLLALSNAPVGHQAYYIVAPETTLADPSLELAQRYYPDVPIRGDLSDHTGFFDCAKAARLLGWHHDQP
jgi:UDP-glucose 4-epimerase